MMDWCMHVLIQKPETTDFCGNRKALCSTQKVARIKFRLFDKHPYKRCNGEYLEFSNSTTWWIGLSLLSTYFILFLGLLVHSHHLQRTPKIMSFISVFAWNGVFVPFPSYQQLEPTAICPQMSFRLCLLFQLLALGVAEGGVRHLVQLWSASTRAGSDQLKQSRVEVDIASRCPTNAFHGGSFAWRPRLSLF